MAQPKRKSPERPNSRKPVKKPARIVVLGEALLGLMGRHPRLLAGVGTFVVVFSFVAANALWYQPRHHPAPLLATRMIDEQETAPNDVAMNAAPTESDVEDEPGVTTFRIERQDDPSAAVTKPAAPAAKPSELVRSIQRELANLGLYNGPADGLEGAHTTAAIAFYEETEGLKPTGKVSQALLDRLSKPSKNVAVLPEDRPAYDKTASTKPAGDDVAALINESNDMPAVAIPQPKPVSPALVMKIQQALADMAYKGVKVDGIAGDATRAAIRSFEKSYRMPVTGEPSQKLLDKLKSIGAV